MNYLMKRKFAIITELGVKKLIKSHKEWHSAMEQYDEEKITQLSQQLQYSPLFISLCLQRGLDSEEKIKQFVCPDDTKTINDPFLMHDMQKAVERIHQAIEMGERVTVYGDYDAGATRSQVKSLRTSF